jgi:hypothetical protein
VACGARLFRLVSSTTSSLHTHTGETGESQRARTGLESCGSRSFATAFLASIDSTSPADAPARTSRGLERAERHQTRWAICGTSVAPGEHVIRARALLKTHAHMELIHTISEFRRVTGWFRPTAVTDSLASNLRLAAIRIGAPKGCRPKTVCDSRALSTLTSRLSSGT